MFLSNICLVFCVMVSFVHINAMPSSSVYQKHQEQSNEDFEGNGVEEALQRSMEIPPWAYKRNSPLCDYRLQFRPLPLTSALCGYGLFEFF